MGSASEIAPTAILALADSPTSSTKSARIAAKVMRHACTFNENTESNITSARVHEPMNPRGSPMPHARGREKRRRKDERRLCGSQTASI